MFKTKLDERRLKGLEFNCDESFTRKHHCKKLFWLESVDKEDEIDEAATKAIKEKQLEISLNAIIGVSSMQNMSVKGNLDRKPVSTLIDSGSAHSFVNGNVMKHLNLPAEHRHGLRMVVANGGKS